MAMTGEQIYHNFDSGKPEPLQDAADKVTRLAGSYQAIAQKFEAVQNRMMQSWTGGAAQAAAHGAAPLAPAMRLSAEHLSDYARAHDRQWQAFHTARQTVQPVPPMPAALNPLELIMIVDTQGIGTALEAVRSHHDAVAAHNAAAEHNVRVMEGYRGATDANRNMPADYPWPKYGGSTFATDDGGDGKKPGDDGDDFRESGGSGEKTTPGGGRLGGSGDGSSTGTVEPSSAGTLAPTKDADGWTNRRLDPPPPPPSTDPLVTPPPNRGGKDQDTDRDRDRSERDDEETVWPGEEGPEGPEPPGWPGPDLGDGGNDGGDDGDVGDDTTPAFSSPGDSAAARDSGSWGPVGGGSWGGGDRTGGDPLRTGGGTAFGVGGPGGESGAGRGAGAAAGGGFRSGPAGGRGGAGGFGGAVPSRGRGDEDDVHDRPEYLVEPDPNSLFGTDEQASSPVIGAEWKPE